MNSNGGHGIAELQAAILIIVVTISLAYLVYSEFPRPRNMGRLTFLNKSHILTGSPSIVMIVVRPSAIATLESVQIDSSSSLDGLFRFDGTHFSTSSSLCWPSGLTFFSVYSASAGQLSATTDGLSWLSGSWSGSTAAAPGWNEVMISNASVCSVGLPDGSVVQSKGKEVSAMPLIGAQNSTSFTFYVPTDEAAHTILLTFQGGLDVIAI